ncbi:hemicentin-2, partial [Bombina bombina]|uniref:hemicentin-2 n=1 Tax=Bombina bombina TaxID=8345 RepID=UPI00235A889C
MWLCQLKELQILLRGHPSQLKRVPPKLQNLSMSSGVTIATNTKRAVSMEMRMDSPDRTAPISQLPHAGLVIQSPPGFLYEGSSVTLTCSGKGLMAFHNSVRWQHGGAPVHPSTRLSVKATMLHIEGLSEDDGGEWSCDHDGARASHKLRVIAISGPDDLSVYSTVGSHVELPCKMTEVFDKTVVSGRWMRVTGSRDQFTNLQINENWEKLVMYPVTPIDAGIYRCQVTHAQHQMVKRVHLKVMQVSPSGPGYIREGTALQLLCSVSGTEGDEHYEWRGPSPHHQVQWG